METIDPEITRFTVELKKALEKARKEEWNKLLDKLFTIQGEYKLPEEAEKLMYELLKDSKDMVEGGELI